MKATAELQRQTVITDITSGVGTGAPSSWGPRVVGPQNMGGATVLKVGGAILRAERAKKIFDPPLFGQWAGQNIA